jgi:hypothetical protein
VSTLTIEIWHRVCGALSSGIYAILHYALVEFTVFGFYEVHCATVSQSPTRSPDSRANEISEPCGILNSSSPRVCEIRTHACDCATGVEDEWIYALVFYEPEVQTYASLLHTMIGFVASVSREPK